MKQLHKVRVDGKNSVYEVQKAMGGPEPSLTFLGNKAARVSILMGGKLDKCLVEALTHLYDSLITKNVDGLTFEFNLRNVGLDTNDHLILRDPVYDSGITVKLKKERAENKV
jgi:hypothetical protein